MSDIHQWEASQLHEAFKKRTLSPVEVTKALFERIDTFEAAINAFVLIDRDGAMAAAKDSEARYHRGEALGPADGIAVTVKDNINLKGFPCRKGSKATPDAAESFDAPSVARLREAGAVIFARTTMPDYGMLSSGLSSFHPLARNPWDLSRTPGGSSAGAGAAAAAGYGPLHLGTDIGGSVRLPAGWCGIVGLKPSNGRVPVDPPYYGRCAGPMTRTVTDAALAMRELSRPDARDGTALPPQAIDWLALDGLDPKGLRLGLMLEAGVGLPLDPAVRDVVEDAARRLAAAGAVIEPVAPILTREMLDGLDTFWRQRAWSEIGALSPERQASVLPYIRAWAETARSLSGAAVFAGMSQMARMRDAALAATQPFDFLIGPVAPVPAFPAELPSPTNDPRRPFEHIGYTVAFNMSEQPAVSVPAGFTPEGLPVGLQIVGHRFDDRGVLRLARLVEKIRPALAPYPVR